MPGCAEWEKIQSVDTIIAVATEILDGFIDDDVSVIGVTGQMHGIVYVDTYGKAVSPLYTWQDERGNLPYKDTTYASYLNSFSGYGNVIDFYNKENGLVPVDDVCYCTIHDTIPIGHKHKKQTLRSNKTVTSKYNGCTLLQFSFLTKAFKSGGSVKILRF